MAKITYPKTDNEKAKLYIHCMLEVKQRIAAVQSILASDTIPLFKHEMCFLHLRHICEVISIACLAAQGDYDTHRAFTEAYSPPKIFKALKKLYPHFFPQPCQIVTTGNRHELTANTKPGAYKEEDIIRLWNTAGDHLHRASVTKYLSTTYRPPPSLEPISRHIEGIIRLLESHLVLIQQDGPLSVLLQVAIEDGEGGLQAQFLRIDSDAGTMAIEEHRASVR